LHFIFPFPYLNYLSLYHINIQYVTWLDITNDFNNINATIGVTKALFRINHLSTRRTGPELAPAQLEGQKALLEHDAARTRRYRGIGPWQPRGQRPRPEGGPPPASAGRPNPSSPSNLTFNFLLFY
jgi:hypothetical protein